MRAAVVTLSLTLAACGLAQARPLPPDAPFATIDEAVEFLATAEVVEREELPMGINRPDRMRLRAGEVEARAVFRTVYDHRDVGTWGFVDSYLSELAAFELARLLGYDAIPPTVLRRAGKRGSLQLWIEGAMTEAERLEKGIEPPPEQAEHFHRQRQMADLFDQLIANTDRHMGNFLVTPDWTLWLVDHTRSFDGRRELRDPDTVQRVERRVWERLLTVSDQEIRQRVKPYVKGTHVASLLERRRRVVALVKERIAAEGEDAVVFAAP
ncbi:MAG TPA: hypothetical protein VMT16_12570 [Thermoanaerobaculia bacterium]|nr:hypothetical protein [Thermoanaerobaculia bacterium]